MCKSYHFVHKLYNSGCVIQQPSRYSVSRIPLFRLYFNSVLECPMKLSVTPYKLTFTILVLVTVI
jgi:hypothetical protein